MDSHVLLQDERACSELLGDQPFGIDVRWDDACVEHSCQIWQVCLGAVKVESHGPLVKGDDFRDRVKRGRNPRPDVRLEQPVECVDYVLRFELLAVAEFHTFSKVKCVLREVVVGLPRHRQHRYKGKIVGVEQD